MAGIGAAFSLLIANIEKVSQFISLAYVRFAMLLLLVGLVASVIARFLSAMVSAALGGYEAGTALGKEITESGKPFDLDLFLKEFERGLFPLQRWFARKSIEKAKSGFRCQRPHARKVVASPSNGYFHRGAVGYSRGRRASGWSEDPVA